MAEDGTASSQRAAWKLVEERQEQDRPKPGEPNLGLSVMLRTMENH